MARSDLEGDRSYWWSKFEEFCTFVLIPKRKALDLTQEQMAQRIGIHQSSVSKVETALQMPKDYPTAKAYAEHYELGPKDTHDWLELLSGITIEEAPLPPELVLAVFSNQLQTIRQIRRRGVPDLAIEAASVTGDQIRQTIRRVESTKIHQPLQEILGHLLYEQGGSYHEVLLPNQVLPYTRPISKELKEIAQALGKVEFFGLAQLVLGGSHFVARQDDLAIPLYEEAVLALESAERQIEAVRGIAIAWAQLQDKSEFEKAETKAREIIEKGQWVRLAMVCSLVEGLGHAQGLLKLEQAFKTLEESRDQYSTIQHTDQAEPRFIVQLAFSQIDSMVHLGTADTRAFEAIGMEGLRTAQEHGYERYATRIENLLKKHLN